MCGFISSSICSVLLLARSHLGHVRPCFPPLPPHASQALCNLLSLPDLFRPRCFILFSRRQAASVPLVPSCPRGGSCFFSSCAAVVPSRGGEAASSLPVVFLGLGCKVEGEKPSTPGETAGRKISVGFAFPAGLGTTLGEPLTLQRGVYCTPRNGKGGGTRKKQEKVKAKNLASEALI